MTGRCKTASTFLHMPAQLLLVLPEITIKTEPPDFIENCAFVSDTSDPLNNGAYEVYTVNTAELQKGAESDEANLKLWSPHGLFPEFSSHVQPLLHGATMTARRHKALSCALRDEIIKFLNKNKLIQNPNTSVMRWEYCALGRSLAARYPNMALGPSQAWHTATSKTKECLESLHKAPHRNQKGPEVEGN
ncbi:hypothetical protein MTO96_006479 [Rhipicephalus appendiculatus]